MKTTRTESEMNKPIKQRKDTTMKTTRRQNLIAAALVCALALVGLTIPNKTRSG